MEAQSTQQTQDPAQDGLKAERVQGEMVALAEPFRLSLKAERVQEPVSVVAPAGGTVSLGYEISCNQMQGVTVELEEPRIVVHLFTTGGQVAA